MATGRNLVANYLGQGWNALMSFAFIPVYIAYLGIEAYGLIGLFALLTAWLALFDMGLSPMLNREMARFTAGRHTPDSIRDLLRSVEIVALCVALAIAIGVALSSGWLAANWLKADSLPVPVVAQAFTIMGAVTALRFVEAVYRSSILGLQRQVAFNIVYSTMATLRGAGAVAALAFIAPTIQVFFVWQGVVSLATIAVLAVFTYRSLPPAGRTARFSLAALARVWRFAGGMVGITCVTLLLTQIDKILLSRLLPLADYGYYTLAAVVAGALFMLVTPIMQAHYPRLSELREAGDELAFSEAYHRAAQLVSVLPGSAAIVLAMFSDVFLSFWTQDSDIVARSAVLLSLLVTGNLLNAIMSVPYRAQLAHGWTSLSVYANVVAAVIIVPTILLIVPRYGAPGAAGVWIALNAGYMVFGVQFMFRRILKKEQWRWYRDDLLRPLASAAAVCGVLRWALPSPAAPLEQFAVLAVASVATLAAASASCPLLRDFVENTRRLWLVSAGWRCPRRNSPRF